VHFTVQLVPNFSRHLPVNTKTGMSSSDSISLSTSSSESTESERSRGWQFDEEVLVKLYACHLKGCKCGHRFPGES